MTLGSSPTTSEMTSASAGPGACAASQPPLMAERCLRTVFSAWMSAPARSSCIRRRPLVVERDAFGGHGHQRRGAARQQDEQRSPSSRPRPVPARGARRARSRRSGSDGRRRSTRTAAGTGAGATLTTRPARMRDPGRRAAAAAIAGAALPAAITRRRSRSARAHRRSRESSRLDLGERAFHQRSGAAAAIPARTIARRSCRRSGSERVSVFAWGPTRTRGRSRRRIS